MTNIQRILFLAFPNVGEQDLLAPWELFKSVAWSRGARGESLEVTLGSFDGAAVTTQMGAKLAMDRKVELSERYDLVYVPGGIGAGALSQNAEALEFLRAHHREGRWVAANCAGVGVLHRSGILAGASLPAQGTPITNPRRAWLVDSERKLFTSGGAATVHPGTMALVTELFGEAQARELAAGWDTLPLHGDALFSKLGPEMNDDPATAAGLQDQWENLFLPPVVSSRAADAA